MQRLPTQPSLEQAQIRIVGLQFLFLRGQRRLGLLRAAGQWCRLAAQRSMPLLAVPRFGFRDRAAQPALIVLWRKDDHHLQQSSVGQFIG